ncbi:MAG TPA: hypothetical protein P5207_06055, partial [Candidatus Sabulitectum sp.]|nr:hypothetical protein [Candidatus Sabulitectum sp.]
AKETGGSEVFRERAPLTLPTKREYNEPSCLVTAAPRGGTSIRHPLRKERLRMTPPTTNPRDAAPKANVGKQIELEQDYVDGLFVADCLGHLAENGCTMGGVYSIIEGSPEDPNTSFGMIRGDTLSMRATAWVMKLLQEKMTGTMVLSTSDALGGGYGLDVHSSLRSDGKLCIVVVNKHLTQDFNTEVVLHGFTSSGYSEVWSIENDAPMEAPYNGTTGIQFRGNLWGSGSSFSRVFPAASVTVLLVHPEGSGTPPVVPGAGLAVAPVPVCGSSRVLVTLAEPAFVRLQVFDLAGRAVHELCSEFFPAGEISVDLDAGELPGGVYAVAGDIGDSSVSVRFAVI